MIKLSDYVMQFFTRKNINDIFMVSGGGIMHLVDSVGKTEGMKYYCNYHEQACAISAEGYARVTGKPGVCLVTVGPGAVNAIAGIVGAWYDSLPMIVIAGQVRTQIMADFSKIRQMGPQEGNAIDMAKPVTKYAVTVTDPKQIRYELEKCLYMSMEGRPGPVWLELPLDVQGAMIEEKDLVPFTPEPLSTSKEVLATKIAQVAELIKASQRPIIIAGNGFRIANAQPELISFINEFKIPVILPYTAKDLVPEDTELYVGVFGTAGQRRANFAIQNSDLVLSLASGLCISKTGFNFDGFAPKAKKVIVDIDEGQLNHQVIKPHVAVQADIRAFMPALSSQLRGHKLPIDPRWYEACQMWKQKYPIILPEHFEDKAHVNSYVFMDVLSNYMKPGESLSVGNGLDCVSYYQAFKVKDDQRTIISGNWGSMGWDLPLAIGACIGRNKQRAVCVTGDGSLQWNVQEMLTAKCYELPLKVFVFNNRGYSAIRATQKTFSEGRFVGADAGSGVINPDFAKLADAFGWGYSSIKTNDELQKGIAAVFTDNKPHLCEVTINPDQWISPRSSSYKREDGTIESRPLEDMAPFLPREEVKLNMSLFE